MSSQYSTDTSSQMTFVKFILAIEEFVRTHKRLRKIHLPELRVPTTVQTLVWLGIFFFAVSWPLAPTVALIITSDWEHLPFGLGMSIAVYMMFFRDFIFEKTKLGRWVTALPYGARYLFATASLLCSIALAYILLTSELFFPTNVAGESRFLASTAAGILIVLLSGFGLSAQQKLTKHDIKRAFITMENLIFVLGVAVAAVAVAQSAYGINYAKELAIADQYHAALLARPYSTKIDEDIRAANSVRMNYYGFNIIIFILLLLKKHLHTKLQILKDGLDSRYKVIITEKLSIKYGRHFSEIIMLMLILDILVSNYFKHYIVGSVALVVLSFLGIVVDVAKRFATQRVVNVLEK